MVLAEDRVFVALDLRRVRGEAPLTCDLYIKEKGQYVLYREGSQSFTSKERERLLESGVSSLWVNVTGGHEWRSRNQVASLLALPDEEVSHFTKAGILNGLAMGTVRKAIAGSVSREALRGVEHMVDMAVGFLTRSQTAFSTLLSVMLHD